MKTKILFLFLMVAPHFASLQAFDTSFGTIYFNGFHFQNNLEIPITIKVEGTCIVTARILGLPNEVRSINETITIQPNSQERVIPVSITSGSSLVSYQTVKFYIQDRSNPTIWNEGFDYSNDNIEFKVSDYSPSNYEMIRDTKIGNNLTRFYDIVPNVGFKFKLNESATDTYDIIFNCSYETNKQNPLFDPITNPYLYQTIHMRDTITMTGGKTKKVMSGRDIRKILSANFKIISHRTGYVHDISTYNFTGEILFGKVLKVYRNMNETRAEEFYFSYCIDELMSLNAPRFEERDVQNNLNLNTLSVYPNPATDHINIGYELEQSTEITIYSMGGKIMDKVMLNADVNSTRIETTHYPIGMYIYKYGEHTGKFIVK